jgi:hypothetical protein
MIGKLAGQTNQVQLTRAPEHLMACHVIPVTARQLTTGMPPLDRAMEQKNNRSRQTCSLLILGDIST